MQTMEPSNKYFAKTINDYTELIKIVARIEYTRLSSSSHVIDYEELVNIGATAVYVILTSQPKTQHKDSYMSTAIKWAIRNEFRRRYKWYSCKHSFKDSNLESDEDLGLNDNNIREAIYETIFSIEELADADNPLEIQDTSWTPEQNIEFKEISKALKLALKELPPRERIVLEMKFYKNKKVKEIAEELNVTSSRITRIIQTGLDRLKTLLILKDFI